MKKVLSSWMCLVLSFVLMFSIDTIGYAANLGYPDEMPTIQNKIEYVNSDNSLSYYTEYISKMAEDRFVIPGLEATTTYNDADGFVTVDSMVPQGMCKVGKYTLISAYDSDDVCKSVIYVLNESKELVKTLILPEKFHAGGLAYDSTNKIILFAKSYKNCLAGLTKDAFNEYLKAEDSYARIKFTFKESVADINSPSASSVTYYKGKIYVTSFNTGDKSVAICYLPIYDELTSTYTLTYQFKFKVPNHTQGITLLRYKDKTRMFATVSYGRSEQKPYYKNYLYTYTLNTTTGAKTLDNILACPPMMQQTFVNDNKLYCVFETASKKYRTVNKDPIDEVLSLDVSLICDEAYGNNINIDYNNVDNGKKVLLTSNIEGAKLYYSTSGSAPYISKTKVANGSLFKEYTKTSTSSIYAVAVINGRIVASDYMYIKVNQANPPKKLKKSKTTKSTISIKWTKAKDTNGYYIYRKDKKDGKYVKIAKVKSSKTTYKDTKLKKNKTYYYKVKAYKKGYSNSKYTNVLTVKTKKG